jgi:hypothetical protein
MSPRSRAKKNWNLMLAFIAVVMLIIGFMAIGPQFRPQPQPQTQQAVTGYRYPVPPSYQPPGESEQGGILDFIVKPIAQALGFSTPPPPPGSETVGLDAEFGITSSSGQSLIFTKNVLSGVYVGQVGMAGVYIKPSLGTARAMKLFDEANPEAEGEIWVSPVIKVRVFNGTPVGYNFKTTVKLVVDGQVIDSQTLEKSGAGPPPQSIKMDKVSVKGKDLHKILKTPKGQLPSIGKGTLRRVAYLSGLQPIQQATPVVEGHQVCFYTDYEGVVIFRDPVTGEESPAYRKLENANLGCFDFAVAETGDFEMRIERNVTVAPIAEVMTTGEIGMGTLQTETVTQTITVPVGPSEYRTVTVTSVKTKVVTTTVTTTVTVYVGGGSALHNSTVTVLEDGVWMPKILDDVRVGDLVLTDRGFLRVVEKREVTVDNLYTIHVEGGYVLRADDAQPILTKNGAKRVGQLAVGDEVYTIAGWRRVQGIDVARFNKPIIKVIDLRFEKFAFYYVDGILVEDYKTYSGVILIRSPYEAFIFIGRG